MKNDFEELFNNIKNLIEEVDRYIENAFVNKSLCKDDCEKYMRGVYDGQSRAYMVMRDKLEDIVIQFEKEEE